MPTKNPRSGSRACALLLMLFCLAAPAIAQERLAFRARELVTGVGPRVENALMLVVDGRIEAIRSGGEVPKGYRLVDLGDACIAAGMIDVASKATVPLDLKEGSLAVDLESRAAEVVVPGHRDLGLLRSAGVTSVVVLPDDAAVISGFGAVMKTLDEPAFVSRKGPVALALTNDVNSDRRFPTSFMGALKMLGDELARPAAPEIKEVRDGKRPAFCRVATEVELRGALRTMQALSCPLVLVTDGSLRGVLDAVGERKIDVVLPAANFETSKRDLLLPGQAAAMGHRVALRADTPSRAPEALRLGAALAVHNGMDAEAAWAAVTTVPARMAGVAERIGSLAAGRDADFIVLSGHPIDLSSVLRRSYIGGKLVYTRPPQKEKADS